MQRLIFVKLEQCPTRLVREGINEPIHFSDWAAPSVPVVKSDKSVRICGDFKTTINQVSKLDCWIATLFQRLKSSLPSCQVVRSFKSKDHVVINTQ